MDVIFGVVVRGRVQGVGYRAWAEITALELGVEGWIRNCRDGSVEAVLAGPEETVLTMIELCRDGPRGAQVTAIDQREADLQIWRCAARAIYFPCWRPPERQLLRRTAAQTRPAARGRRRAWTPAGRDRQAT